ncbi:MAG: YIP1 family protein [Chloroflexaceae bacterium]|nr:YIP1 family protein [Chloroflexaceae bacterium]
MGSGSMLNMLHLGIRGLLLDEATYQQQREASDGLKQGGMLVALVGLAVGVAALIGQIFEVLASPDPQVVQATVYEGLTAMPWYADLSNEPGFQAAFRQTFDQVFQLVTMVISGSIGWGLAGVVLTPLLYLGVWLVYGLCAHLVARWLGGRGTLNQTLACLSLAAGAHLLALVQVVPFAQVSGAILLSLIASYLAVRESHQLKPWGAFWATTFVPLLLLVLFMMGACMLPVVFPLIS